MEEYMAQFNAFQPELAIWTLYQSGQIAGALTVIASAIFIWLALRVAVQTRDRQDTNMIQKIFASLFGILVVYGTFIQWTENFGVLTGTIAGFNQVAEAGKSAGVELSNQAKFFVDYYSFAADGLSYPGIPGSLFLLVVLGMILGAIWYPKD